jgi:hypothetical protein
VKQQLAKYHETKPKTIDEDPVKLARVQSLQILDSQCETHIQNFKQKDLDKFITKLKARSKIARTIKF